MRQTDIACAIAGLQSARGRLTCSHITFHPRRCGGYATAGENEEFLQARMAFGPSHIPRRPTRMFRFQRPQHDCRRIVSQSSDASPARFQSTTRPFSQFHSHSAACAVYAGGTFDLGSHEPGVRAVFVQPGPDDVYTMCRLAARITKTAGYFAGVSHLPSRGKTIQCS